MNELKSLLEVFEKEASLQEKLLGLLAKERTAIVKLKQEEMDTICQEKSLLLEKIQAVELKRNGLLDELREIAKTESPQKLEQLLELLPLNSFKPQVAKAGARLKEVAIAVKTLNDQNADLVKQSLGLISSTLAIIRQSPDSGLPTYTAKGRLRNPEQETTQLKKSLTTEA